MPDNLYGKHLVVRIGNKCNFYFCFNISITKKEMKKFNYIVFAAVIIVACGQEEMPPSNTDNTQAEAKSITVQTVNKYRDGDIIFQTSGSGQSKAIQLATHSEYSHCGLMFKRKNGKDEWSVLEAIQPVKWTPLSEWIARGDDQHYVIKRVITDSIIPDKSLQELRKIAEQYLGKDYDLLFDWSDEKIYCSELVWKSYYNLNKTKVGEPQQLSEFDLSNPVVRQKMKERYGSQVPLQETVISPAAIFDSELLETIESK
ncbi:MAG: YiiX family permuted papain-like enzyme [Flavobacteriales bacterium]|nr:YiiX family permuted papain-like enzyme [Flavobacteriales bacterium]